MSMAERIYKRLNKEGTESEKDLCNEILQMVIESPKDNLDRINKILWCIADLYAEIDNDEERIKENLNKINLYDYIVMVTDLYEDMNIEHPNERKRRLEEEEKRKESFPPLKLVQ